MFDKLKQQPLIGLTLALAAAYVIAHFAISFLDGLPSIFEQASEQASDMFITVTFWTAVVAAVAFVYTKRQLLRDSVRSHPRVTATIAAVGFLISAIAASRVIAAELAIGITHTAAQVRGAFVGTADLVLYLLLAAVAVAAARTFRVKRASGVRPQN